MRRLLQKMPSIKSPSTGIAEKVERIKVESLNSSSVLANVKDLVWKPIEFYDDEAIDLMLKITLNRASTLEQASNDPFQTEAKFEHTVKRNDSIEGHQSSKLKHSIEFTSVSDVTSQPIVDLSPLEVFKSALKVKGLKGLEQHLDKQVSLYLTNTGGQMEFQELLPLLVSGPSMFFITFRLDRDLNTQYEIEYETYDQQGDGTTQPKSYKYTSSNTPLDTILQTLASIDAVGTYSFESGKKRSVSLTYRVFLIGTHKDILEKNASNIESEIAKIDKQIKDAVAMATYKKHIIPASENHLIYTVNNFAKDDKDFQLIKSSVQHVIEAGEFHDDYPSYWLVYSLMLQRLEKRTESLEKCFEVAQRCGITDKKDLKEALHFLDRRMGVVRYFPEDELKDVVILDPQVLFDKVTKLIVETFTFEHCFLNQHVLEEFKKGIFSLKEFERISEKVNPDPLVDPKWFAGVLHHLRIAAPFKEDGVQKYFFPCALSHVNEKRKDAKFNDSIIESLICPLVVSFKCNYCPTGLAGALIAYIMQEKVTSGEWEFLTNGIFRDQVTFFVHSTGDKVTLRNFPTHLEIMCIPGPGDREQCPVEDTCVEVKRLIEEGIEIVTKDMNYVCNVDTAFTFYCTAEKCKDSRKHPAKHIEVTGKLRCIKDNSSIFDLPKGHQYWKITGGQANVHHHTNPLISFPKNECDEAQATPNTQATHQLTHLPPNQPVGPCIKSAFRLLLPVASQWQNMGTLLDIPDGQLAAIKSNEQRVESCLREMLNTWLKQTDPPPTWSDLVNAVEPFDPSVAEKVKKC